MIYIKATVEAIVQTLIDEPTTRKYWLHETVSDWESGSDWTHRRLDGSFRADIVVILRGGR